MDFERIYDKIFKEEIKHKLKEKAQEADLIIISDYDKGSINNNLISVLSEYKKKIIVDPKPKNKALFKEVLLVKTNEKEIDSIKKSIFDLKNNKKVEMKFDITQI